MRLLKFPEVGLVQKTWSRLTLALMFAMLSACGGEAEVTNAEADADFAVRKAAMLAEMQAHFDSRLSLPPTVVEALERGELTQAEVDARAQAGEFEKFYQYKTMADLPNDLVWEDGSDLPEVGSPDAKKGGTYYEFLPDFPRTLRLIGPDANGSFRPWILDDMRMQMGRRHPNDTSIDANGNFRYFPGVAQAWAVDKPNKTVYFKINPKARFSDGEPVTTDDVFFGHYMRMTKYVQAPYSNNYFARNFLQLTRFDDHTYALKYPELKPNIFSLALESDPWPLHFFYEFGEDYVQRYQWRFVPTTGPYVIEEGGLKKGRSVTLTRLKDWWAKDLKHWRYRYNPDRIRLTVIRDPAKAVEAFKKGELSTVLLDTPEKYYEKVPSDDPLVTTGHLHRSVFYNDIPRPTWGIWINRDRPHLNNQDVRIGINFAVNWDRVIKEYFRGDFDRMRTSSDGYGEFTHPTLQSRPFDVDQALAHFAKAGFTKRGGDGVLLNDQGERLSFSLNTGYERFKDALTILREEALKAGLEIRLEILDSTTSFKKSTEKQHEITFMAFNTGVEMYPRYWDFYHSVNAYENPWLQDGSPNPDRKLKPVTNNLQSVAIPEMDVLIEAYRASEDVDEMKRLAFQMEERMYEDASFVPGFVIPFLRTGYWRWVRWPEDHNVKLASTRNEFHLMWIDTEMEKETRAARKSGATFEPVDNVYDQYRISEAN